MAPIEREDHATRLECETADSRERCSECGERPDRLLRYFTAMGAKRREHGGLFCSKLCHDIFHGLAPRAKAKEL